MSTHQIQTLAATLRRFADALTPDERAEVRALQTHDVGGLLSPSLRAKAQQAAGALTTADVAQLRLLLEQAGVAATTGEAEVTGYRVAQWEDAYGYKGKIGTGGESLPPAGGATDLEGVAAWGLVGLLAIVGVGGPALLVNDPSLGQRTWSNV